MSDNETEECPHCGESIDPALTENIVPTASGRQRVQHACYKCGKHLTGKDSGQFR